jgi:type I restriction enzyme S subunit
MHLGGLDMALTKYKVGDLVTVIDERNNLGIKDFYGININKEFMPTAANTEGLDETKYKLVRKNRFVYSGMQTGRDECIRVSMYNNNKPVLISPAYTTFEVTATDVVIPLYFFMKFLSKEMDRYGAFCSDGSIRSNLDWDVFCDIDLDLPPIEIQQKYVDVYNAMLANQQSYERGLEDLKLTCDAYIEDLRRKMPCEEIGSYIIRQDIRNGASGTKNVMGVSTSKEFREPTSKVNRNELANYKVVEPRQFSFVQTTHNEKVFAYAFNNTDNDIVVTSVNEVFSVNEEKLLPEYLAMFFNRTEFDRYARFHSWGSARETFTWDDLIKVKIPIANMSVQKSIADIYTVYKYRKYISEKLKAQIKDLCPILIKGSIEEARKEA